MTAGSKRAHRVRRPLAVVLAALLLALVVVVADPGVASAATPQPIPADLWDINPDVPAGTSYIALEGVPGERISAGQSYLYTKADASLTVTEGLTGLTVEVRGDERWTGYFTPPAATQFSTGYLAPANLSWGGESRSCTGIDEWIAIDQIERSGGVLQSVTLRFSQTCQNSTAVLHGKVKWVASDPTTPPGPIDAPSDLWDMAPDVAAGASYVAIDGADGDWVSQGKDWLYTKSDSFIDVTADGATLVVTVDGEEKWTGTFVGMSSIPELRGRVLRRPRRVAGAQPGQGGIAVDGRRARVFRLEQLVHGR